MSKQISTPFDKLRHALELEATSCYCLKNFLTLLALFRAFLFEVKNSFPHVKGEKCSSKTNHSNFGTLACGTLKRFKFFKETCSFSIIVKLSIEQTKTKVKRKDEFNNEQHHGRVFHSARDMQINFKCPFSFSSKKYNNRPKDKNMNICIECRIISKIELFTESSIFISRFKTHSPTNKHTSQSQSSSKTFCSNVRNPFNGEKYIVSL